MNHLGVRVTRVKALRRKAIDPTHKRRYPAVDRVSQPLYIGACGWDVFEIPFYGRARLNCDNYGVNIGNFGSLAHETPEFDPRGES
jgi:hypothetical protein